MMTPSTIDMTDLEDAIDEKLDAQGAEACGAGEGDIHDPDEANRDSESDQDLLRKIREQERTVATCESDLNYAKEEVKACRERFDVEVAKLRGLIRGSQEKHPLFDGANESSKEADGAATEDWRDVEISSLEIADSLATKLYESSIETIGDLVDWQSGGKQIVDIKGVGAAKADKIADALERFWKQNPQYTR